MMHGENRLTEIKNPGPLVGGKLSSLAVVLMIIGVVALGAQYLSNPKLATVAYLEGYFFALCLSLSGIFFVTLNYLTASVWSHPVRRIAEAMSSYLPYSIVGFIVLLALIKMDSTNIYEWNEAGNPAHLHGTKATYLGFGFWAIRGFLYLVLWNIFASHFRKISLAQDVHKQKLVVTLKSAIFLIVFGFSISLFSFDVLMTLRVHWFSTMFGVYCFAGLFQSGLCLLILFSLYLSKRGYLDGVFKKERHLFDLGTWLIAWSTFMAYIMFSQFMLIWYANLPEETVFFRDHFSGGYSNLYTIIFILKWISPFLILMPKPSRRSAKVLVPICISILVAEWLDIYFLVTPEFVHGDAINSHFVMSFLTGVGFFGSFLFVVVRYLKKHPVLAHGEPDMLSSANGDYL